MRSPSATRGQSGFALFHAIVFIAIVVSVITFVTAARTAMLQSQRRAFMATQALYLAEAGVSAAAEKVDRPGRLPDRIEGRLGSGRFEADVSSLTGGRIRIRATGVLGDVTRVIDVTGEVRGGRFVARSWG